MRDEAQLENARVHAAALPDAAAAGLDRAPGRRHAGRAGQAARGDGRRSTARTRAPRASTSATRRIVAPAAGRIGLRADRCRQHIGAGDATGIAVITQLAPIDVEFAVPQDRVPEIQARIAEGARAAGRPRSTARAPAKLDDGVFSTLDNQVDTQTGTVQREGALRERRRRAVPEPVRQRAAAAAHDRRRGRRAGRLRCATAPNGDFVYVVQRRPDGDGARGDARRRDRRRHRDHRGPRRSASASSPKAATA